jgi:hypothetical protein
LNSGAYFGIDLPQFNNSYSLETPLSSLFYVQNVNLYNTHNFFQLTFNLNSFAIKNRLIMIIWQFGLVCYAVVYTFAVQSHPTLVSRYIPWLINYQRKLINVLIYRYTLKFPWKIYLFLWNRYLLKMPLAYTKNYTTKICTARAPCTLLSNFRRHASLTYSIKLILRR